MRHPGRRVTAVLVFALAFAGATVAHAATVGPGPVATSLSGHGYRLDLRLTPNRATTANTITLVLTRHGSPVNGARVRLTFTMLSMSMGNVTSRLTQTGSGRYAHSAPFLGMPGYWSVRIAIAPPHDAPFDVTVFDRMKA